MLNVVLIGVGAVSKSHISAWLKQENARVIGVADFFADRAEAASKMLGAEKWSDDYRDLIDSDDVDAVDICVTEAAHVDVATDAANAGKHILVEKPISTTLTDADLIIDAAEKNNVKLMVAHTHHFYDYGISAKEIIDRGEIGTPVYIKHVSGGGFWQQDWTGTRISAGDTGGNVVTNGIHIVDLTNWWMGSDPISVYAQALNPTSSHMEMNQYFVITIKYENGGIGIVEMSRANMPRTNQFSQITVLGSEGEIRTGSDVNSQWVYKEDGLIFDNGGFLAGFDREINSFVDAVLNDKEPPVTGNDSKVALQVCLAAEVSIKTGSVKQIRS